MLPTKFASMGAPATGGASISRPAEIYVTTDGNNGTGEIGNPAKPFATVAAAVAAGEATVQAYTIILGTGAFSVTRLPASGLRNCFVGAGFQTTLTFMNGGSSGLSAEAVNEVLINLRAEINCNGWSSDDENLGPTSGAEINVQGWGWIIQMTSKGGNAYNPSGYGGGTAGAIIVRGNFDVSGSVDFRNGDDGAGSVSAGGLFTGDGCNLRSATFTTNNTEVITLGRCSYVAGFGGGFSGTFNDYGGNSAW